MVSAHTLTATDGNVGGMSFAISGASTLAATDANSAYAFVVKSGVNGGSGIFRQAVYTATNSGSHTATAKYRSDGTGNLHFIDRRLTLKSH